MAQTQSQDHVFSAYNNNHIHYDVQSQQEVLTK